MLLVIYKSYAYFQETGFLPNGNTNIPMGEGISGAEVEQRLPQLVRVFNSCLKAAKFVVGLVFLVYRKSQPFRLSFNMNLVFV